MLLLHLYGQGAWHDEAYIVGNTNALRLLKEMCEKALAQEEGSTKSKEIFMTNDGEGYPVTVIKVDSEGKWTDMAYPYTEEMAEDHRPNAKHPAEKFYEPIRKEECV